MKSSSPLPEIPAIGFLSEASQEHREFFTSFGKFIRPDSGSIIIQEGEAQESLCLILSGTLHVVVDSSERPILLAKLSKGDSLGEVNLMDPAAASATVIARESCLIWTMTRDELNGLIAADPEAGLAVMKGLLRQLSSRIREMNQKLVGSEQKASFNDFWSNNSQ